MDYLLNGINGEELCNKIRQNTKTSKLPVVLISAYGKVIKSPNDCGCNAFIEKPFDLTTLVTIKQPIEKTDTETIL
jgi:CheY-like chemotaxis protein